MDYQGELEDSDCWIKQMKLGQKGTEASKFTIIYNCKIIMIYISLDDYGM